MGSSADLALVFYWWLTDSFNFLSLVFLFFPAIEIIVWDTHLGMAGRTALCPFCFSFLLLLFPCAFTFTSSFFAVLILFLHGSSIWVLYGVYGVCGVLSPRPRLDLGARFHGYRLGCRHDVTNVTLLGF